MSNEATTNKRAIATARQYSRNGLLRLMTNWVMYGVSLGSRK